MKKSESEDRKFSNFEFNKNKNYNLNQRDCDSYYTTPIACQIG